MRLYACYTQSHFDLLTKHFVPSLPQELYNFKTIRELAQRSDTGEFASGGFQATCLDKVDFIIEALTVETEPFLFSDVDVRFYGPVVADLLECLGNADMAFQWDGPSGRECSGFMVIRPSKQTRFFWQAARARMINAREMDQDAVHWTMSTYPSACTTVILPERYWTYGRNDKHWEPGTPVNPPADLLVHHANWTMGVENKLRLLEAVNMRHEATSPVTYAVPDHGGRCQGASVLPVVDWGPSPPLPSEIDEQLESDIIKACKAVDEEPDCGVVAKYMAPMPLQSTPAGPAVYKGPPIGDQDRIDRAVGMAVPGAKAEVLPEGGGPFPSFEVVSDGGISYRKAENVARCSVGMTMGVVMSTPGERVLPYSEVTRMLEEQRARLTSTYHHPLPLALVLQFWKGDKRRAMELARLLADIEQRRRDDVVFVFARQDNCQMDEEIYKAQLYVGRKFPFMDLVAKVDESKKYPGVCFDAWASAVQQLSDAYHTGRIPYGNAFFFEADGCPIGTDWIDRLKRAHEETLLLGKRVTGPLIRFGGVDASHQVGGHINGSLVMHLSCWDDHPSLRRCPPAVAWDVQHGLVLRMEAGPSQIIRNEHGASGISESAYHVMGKESAWLTSVKDGTPQHWCRRYLEQLRKVGENGNR